MYEELQVCVWLFDRWWGQTTGPVTRMKCRQFMFPQTADTFTFIRVIHNIIDFFTKRVVCLKRAAKPVNADCVSTFVNDKTPDIYSMSKGRMQHLEICESDDMDIFKKISWGYFIPKPKHDKFNRHDTSPSAVVVCLFFLLFYCRITV